MTSRNTLHTSGTGRVGGLVRAGAAGLVLVGVVVGIPAVMAWLVGWPLPTHVPDGDDWWLWVSNPIGSAAIVKILAVLVWVCWAHFVVCLAAEAVNTVREIRADRADPDRERGAWGTAPVTVQVPWGGFSQDLARRLIGAVLVAGTSLSPAGAAMAAAPTPTATVSVSVSDTAAGAGGWLPDRPQTTTAASTPAGTAAEAAARSVAGRSSTPSVLRRYEVVRYDSLWDIAEAHLGSGERWREIYDLNADHPQGDGRALHDPDLIEAGWQLRMPSDATTLPTWDTPPQTPAPDTTPGGGASAGPGASPGGAPTTTDQQNTASSTGTSGSGAAAVPQPSSPALPSDQNTTPMPPTSSTEQRPPATPSTGTTEPKSASAATVPTAGADRETSGSQAGSPGGSSSPAWMLAAFSGGGVLLAGGAFAAWQRGRRRQVRARRPGRAIAAPPASTIGVQRALIETGPAGAIQGGFLDAALRQLAAATVATAGGVPRLVAARMGPTGLDVRLLAPRRDAPVPWSSDETGAWWSVPMQARFDVDPDQMAPYPTLVTVGHRGVHRWLLDLETAGTLHVTGPADRAGGLARFIAAELAVNLWSDTVSVQVTGLGDGLRDLNPDRVEEVDAATATAAVRAAVTATDQLVAQTGHPHAVAGRAAGEGSDSWLPQVIVAGPTITPDAAAGLSAARAPVPEGAAVTVVVAGHGPAPAGGVDLVLAGDGTLTVSTLDGLRLDAEHLTTGEATQIGDLLASARTALDTSVPDDDGPEPWQQFARRDGSLRPRYTTPRTPSDAPAGVDAPGVEVTDSVLPLPDTTYLAAAATTREDLAAVAPRVPAATRAAVTAADPHLDDDLTAWADPDCVRPRLAVLGTIDLRVPHPDRVPERAAYFATLLAYLLGRENGATAEEIAAAFFITAKRARTDMSTLRAWLGTNPQTGRKHLPDATKTPGRGGVYTVRDVLYDADLFRRLRLRGQATGSIDDLVTALDLVTGPPFTGASGSWLIAGDRTDHHLTAAITDVAHTVVTHALAHKPPHLEIAELATRTGRLAAPDADLPDLDTAAILNASGRSARSHLLSTVLIADRDEDPAIPVRTVDLLSEHPEWTHTG